MIFLEELIEVGKKLNLKGERFGLLLIESEAGRDKHGRVRWNCICDCGKNKVVDSRHLVQGKTVSCGCYQIKSAKERNTTHDLSNNHRNLLNIWYAMKRRCYNKKDNHYPVGAGKESKYAMRG